ncbi:unnamed protein product [Chrysodeixis includens]|uniref:Alpha-1,6-mannosyl-glycoprotein 2-beta-N-acetylglucosaminyltransferase n=1 Tax=Chrysodeixis includens TaxID=689277 RepID=A0A9P0BKM8_CHRIL|nr:unnamed protein product [Chrysodeixis includens]
MNFNPEHFVRVYLIIFILAVSSIFYAVYQQVVFVKKQRRDLLHNFHDDNSDNITYSDYLEIRFREKRVNMQNIIKIKALIKKINTRQKVFNAALGPLAHETPVVVIQVHSNVMYLRQLLASLRLANGIHQAFIIFSHDYFSNEINRLIRGIYFVRYMQIFYPYSIQLHPNVYPGHDSTFCTDGYVCTKSNMRDPEAAQLKHHWWWQANQIFDHLEIMQRFNSTLVFLEEGDYVTKDFFFAYRLLKKARNTHCPFCEVLSLAAHEPEMSTYAKRTMMTVEIWTNRIRRTGIAFNTKIWKALKTYSQAFCFHNDYNWDSSFRNVALKKWESNIYMTAISGPRVFHLEKCDDRDSGCRVEYQVEEIQKFLQLISKTLFPWGFVMVVKKEEEFNGSALGLWEDVRDRELCMHFAEHSVWF